MTTPEALDSSPVPIPPVHHPDLAPRPLKRSASVASLPTPPRTQHKRSRSRAGSSASKRAAGDSDSGSDTASGDELPSTYTARIRRTKSKSSGDEAGQPVSLALGGQGHASRKKRRTTFVLPGHDEEEDIEAAFWTGREPSGAASRTERKEEGPEDGKEPERSPSPALLRYRVKAPVSPPPSRRQPHVLPKRASSVEPSAPPATPPPRLFLRAPAALPKTPTKKSKSNRIWPTRDSPNNPFLKEEAETSSKKRSSGWDSTDDEGEVVGAPLVEEGTPTPAPQHGERPTITYVFRGQKATFANPLYNLPPEIEAASKLPVDHPDYEPLEACPPTRLFFSGGKRKVRDCSRQRTTDSEGVKRVKVSNDGEAGSSEEAAKPGREGSQCPDDMTPRHTDALQRAREERERKAKADKERLAPKEGLRAGAIITERDEPMRRAVGPPRCA